MFVYFEDGTNRSLVRELVSQPVLFKCSVYVSYVCVQPFILNLTIKVCLYLLTMFPEDFYPFYSRKLMKKLTTPLPDRLVHDIPTSVTVAEVATE